MVTSLLTLHYTGANEAAALLSAADVPQGRHEPDVSQGPTAGAEAGLPGCFTPTAPPQR